MHYIQPKTIAINPSRTAQSKFTDKQHVNSLKELASMTI